MASKYSQSTDWYYTFDDVTLDRRVGRESVVAPMCSRLQGIDGNHEGGLRPYPGFRAVENGAGNRYELDFYGNGVSHAATITSASSPNTAGTFQLTVTAPEHATVTSAQTTASIALNASAATIVTALEALSNVGSGDITVVASGSGSTLGDADTTLTFTFANDLATQPITFSANLGSMIGGDAETFATTAAGQHDHDATSVVSDFFPVTFLKEANNFCRGFVYRAQGPNGGSSSDILIDYWDSSNGAWTGGVRILSQVSNTEPMNVESWGRFVYVSIRGEDSAVFYYDSGSSSFQTDTPCGPGKRIGVEIEAPVTTGGTIGDTAIATVLDTNSDPDEVGHLTVVRTEDALVTGFPAAQAAGEDDEAVLLLPGSYSCAIRLLDSTTGRRTAISEIGEFYTNDFTDDAGTAEQNYVGVRIVWDTTKFDKAEIYRSIRVEDMGSTVAARIIHHTDTITLADWSYDSGGIYPAGNGSEMDQALFFFKLNDVATSWQPPYQDNRLFEEEIPKGGASCIVDNTLYVGNITDVGPALTTEATDTDKDRRIGQLRWSSTVELSPELFSPYGYYNLKNPGSEIIAITELAGNALGFSKDRQFHLRREGRYIKVHELHVGYGITGPHAYHTVAAMTYFMTDKGLKSVGANGQLDDVRSVNRIILDEWAGQLEDVTMALDSSQSCLYIYNPTLGEAICMWFNTAKVSTLIDLPFTQCRSGYWPIDDTTKTAMWQLEPRAFFLQNAPKDTDSDAISGWKPRIYTPDYRRERLIGAGFGSASPRGTLLQFVGDSRWNLEVDYDGDQIELEQANTVPTANLEGAWAYVMEATDPAYVGTRVQIHSHTSQYVLKVTAATKATWDGLPAAGTRIALSPISFEVIAAPLDQRAETGETTGRSRFHVRHVDSIGAFLSEVGGYPLSDGLDDARLVGQLYRTEGVASPLVAFSYDEQGLLTPNVREGEALRWTTFGERNDNAGQFGVDGNVLCPSVLNRCPDLDFVLLAAEVSGKMQATTTTSEPLR
jgi:hypothetical protein